MVSHIARAAGTENMKNKMSASTDEGIKCGSRLALAPDGGMESAGSFKRRAAASGYEDNVYGKRLALAADGGIQSSGTGSVDARSDGRDASASAGRAAKAAGATSNRLAVTSTLQMAEDYRRSILAGEKVWEQSFA